MITFVSLFLGLVVGSHAVEVAVGDEVAWVEIYLDGRRVADLEGPPWIARCDFGDELVPHELVAVAYGDGEEERDRVRQWINLPRAPAEVGIVLEGGRDGRGRIARLSWESILATVPRAVTVTFDGRPLEAADPRRVEIPPHDPAQLHLLRAEVDFTDSVSSIAEVVFGGTYVDEVASELTAAPVRLGGGRELPPPEALRGWLLAAGAPLEVVAVEAGEAEVLFVRDEEARTPLLRMEGYLRRLLRALPQGGRPSGGDLLRLAIPLSEEHRLQMLWPTPELHLGAGRRYALFPGSPQFTSNDVGVYWILARVRLEGARAAEQKLADAVAVAGMAAAGRKRRRAVVLVLSRDPQDASQLAAAQVRRYLERLQVPFFVWSVEPRPGPGVAAWGEVTDVSSPARLEAGVRALNEALARQRIVWVRGIHLPQEIALSAAAAAAGLELAR